MVQVLHDSKKKDFVSWGLDLEFQFPLGSKKSNSRSRIQVYQEIVLCWLITTDSSAQRIGFSQTTHAWRARKGLACTLSAGALIVVDARLSKDYFDNRIKEI